MLNYNVMAAVQLLQCGATLTCCQALTVLTEDFLVSSLASFSAPALSLERMLPICWPAPAPLDRDRNLLLEFLALLTTFNIMAGIYVLHITESVVSNDFYVQFYVYYLRWFVIMSFQHGHKQTNRNR